jgi:isopentenyl phosphate kinase
MSTILKIGGSVITYKADERVAIRESVLDCCLSQIADFRRQSDDALYLIHGAGSFGHTAAKAMYAGLMTPEDVHNRVRKLNAAVTEHCERVGLEVENHFPYDHCTYDSSTKEYRIDRLWDEMQQTVRKKKIALTLGDIIPTGDGSDYKVLSGDMLAVLFAERSVAEEPCTRIIMATDVDGVFDKNPGLYPDAEIVPLIYSDESQDIAFELKSTDVTRGMHGKVGLLKRAARNGIPCHIIRGDVEGNLALALRGDVSIGTRILPRKVASDSNRRPRT